jgi:hypothetical protein
MAEIKGALLKAWMSFLNERYGGETVISAIGTLAQADKQMMGARFLDSSWYSYETLHTMRRLTRVLVTPADGDLSNTIGRHMAQEVFTGVYRSLLAADPVKQVEKFAWISEFFFRETRELQTEITSQLACVVRYQYKQAARPTRGICLSLLGFWTRTLELSGASSVVAEQMKCVLDGANCCEFEFKWESVAARTI